MDLNTVVSHSVQSLCEDELLCREVDSMSTLDSDGEEGTLRNVFGESKPGRIPVPMRPLQMFVFARVALALRAAPEKLENVLGLFDCLIASFLIVAGISSERSLDDPRHR